MKREGGKRSTSLKGSSSIDNGNNTSELFICFTSKYMVSPGRRPLDSTSPISLSTSVSRRLRSSGGSIKGGVEKGLSSPMFPSTTTSSTRKRGGCTLENPEPCSPKVTCIGQVRVKTKQHRNNNNQRCWVHLPITVCEAFRAFLGADFNCFMPCSRSSCLDDRHSIKNEKAGTWLVGNEIELVVGGGDAEEEEDEEEERSKSRGRRHVFDGIEFNEKKEKGGDGRVSICVPPKNALLLMRCGSDPVKMAALANRFWGSSDVDEEEDDAKEEEEEERGKELEMREETCENSVAFVGEACDEEKHETSSVPNQAEETCAAGNDEIVRMFVQLVEDDFRFAVETEREEQEKQLEEERVRERESVIITHEMRENGVLLLSIKVSKDLLKMQPARLSCSYPLREHKLLTRCNSAPTSPTAFGF